MSTGGPMYPPPDQQPPSLGMPQQGAAPVFQLAEWILRVLATLIDGALGWAFLIVGSILNGGHRGDIYNLFALFGFIFGIWQLWMQGTMGQTIGKRAIKLRVVSEADAGFIGGWMSIARSIVHIVDLLPCALGYLWPIWDPKRQTFADKIMKTVVIKVR